MYQDKIKQYKQKYEWKTFQFPVSAQEAGEEIEKISIAKGGEIQAKDIVEKAKDADTVLHKCFEWNDKIAAEKHREATARVMLGNLIVTEIQINGETIVQPTRAFVNVSVASDDTERRYMNIGNVLENEECKNSMLQNALRELQAFQKKYSVLQELAGFMDEIQKTLEVM